MRISEIDTIKNGAFYTTDEIRHQPSLWNKIWKSVNEQRNEIKSFLTKVESQCDSIILTGAGTSAYAGLTVQKHFRENLGMIAEPISSTHIVTHPKNFLLSSKSVCLVSFARSGNSPESCAAVDLVAKNSKNFFHLIITCNPEGALASLEKNNENSYTFVLPEEANDKSLAMTSSFSGMVLASILIARINDIELLEKEVNKLSYWGNYCLEKSNYIWSVASQKFDRAIFLGSGALFGIAKESQLKMQELTDGLVISKHDSFLGLRHGPKAVIDENTIVVHFLNCDLHALKYENDLVKTMRDSSNPLGQLAIGQNIGCNPHVDWSINFETKDDPIDKDLYSVLSILPTQLLSLFKSIQLGIRPDNPSRNGAISRVVKGVSIYH